MTKFQDNCITRVKALLSSVSGIPKIDFKEKHIQANDVMGDVLNLLRRAFGFTEIPYEIKELAETSFHVKFRFKNHDFEIYIYEDNPEMHRDDTAYICELPDYDSETEMIQDFVSHLSEAVSSEHFVGNCGTSRREWIVLVAILIFSFAAIIVSGLWVFHFFLKQFG